MNSKATNIRMPRSTTLPIWGALGMTNEKSEVFLKKWHRRSES